MTYDLVLSPYHNTEQNKNIEPYNKIRIPS